jgi:glycosyltransferase 2 family protein
VGKSGRLRLPSSWRCFILSNLMTRKTLVKLCFSGVLLFALMRTTDLAHLWSTVQKIQIPVLALVCLGYALGQCLSAFKWCLLLRYGGIDVGYPQALKAYFAGMFANMFGLGTIGGDLTRALLVSAGSDKKSLAITCVAVDRIHGLAVLSAVGSIVFLLSSLGLASPSPVQPWLLTMLPIIFFGTVGALFVGPLVIKNILPANHRLHTKVTNLTQAFPLAPKKLITVSAVSAIFHSLQISLHWVMGYALGLDLSWGLLFTAIPFVNILTSLPISWNGLGVRENAYGYLLSPHALDTDQVLVFGAIWLFATTLSSAIGGIAGTVNQDLPRKMPGSITVKAPGKGTKSHKVTQTPA